MAVIHTEVAFFGRKSASVHRLSFECACIMLRQISSLMHSFQDEAQAANDAVFFSTANRPRRQTGLILGFRVDKYYLLFQF